jgi:hypothetical protein
MAEISSAEDVGGTGTVANPNIPHAMVNIIKSTEFSAHMSTKS